MKLLTALTILTLMTLGCATAPSQKTEGGAAAGTRQTYHEYEAKAQIQDKIKNTSHNVGIDIYSYSNQAMRMDISSTLGISVAHLLLRGKNISYMVKPWSRYYYGPVSENSLSPLLKMKLDPNLFYAFLYDQPVTGSDWQCLFEQGLIRSCANKIQSLEVEWQEREGERRRVLVKSPRFEINFLIKSHRTIVELPPQTFVLEAPEGYKKIPLN